MTARGFCFLRFRHRAHQGQLIQRFRRHGSFAARLVLGLTVRSISRRVAQERGRVEIKQAHSLLGQGLLQLRPFCVERVKIALLAAGTGFELPLMNAKLERDFSMVIWPENYFEPIRLSLSENPNFLGNHLRQCGHTRGVRAGCFRAADRFGVLIW